MGPMAVLNTPKEVMLQIFITIKNASPLVGFEPTSLGSCGKYANN
jgi:hypothetical protein